MPNNNKTTLTLKYLTPANKTKTKLLCLECEKPFLKYIGPKTIEVECPHCGSFDTEPE
jgi:Zn finger protein HypA/HybF involved in hydrogenase expression